MIQESDANSHLIARLVAAAIGVVAVLLAFFSL